MKISAKRLDGVPETLLYTLYMRYRESKRDDAIVKDGRFAEIVDLVDYDFSELALLPETAQLFVACRTLIFDTVARRFISENPEGLIVSLGAGLDFRFLRVDNGRITGVDIDLPGVIDLKKEIFPERDRWEFIPSSVLDFSWLDRIHSHGKKILFIAEGLLPYFDHEENGALISAISQNFPDSELIFDISSGYYQQMLEKNKSPYPFLKKIYSMAKGYIDHWKELEALEPGVRFITEYY
ncbi:MAG: class I SAM-dependent methyltransferase, partial [bacterium]|nr:class I SAM-dependent methyltransferase [bacterium]